jgi:hypothetical protein
LAAILICWIEKIVYIFTACQKIKTFNSAVVLNYSTIFNFQEKVFPYVCCNLAGLSVSNINRPDLSCLFGVQNEPLKN